MRRSLQDAKCIAIRRPSHHCELSGPWIRLGSADANATYVVSLLKRAMILIAAFAATPAVRAAELDGIWMPNTQLVHGDRLLLNGLGLRTYSIFRIGIYVAGLYLEQRSDNPKAILHSDKMKLIQIRFLHNVSAEEARASWRSAFERTCEPPCRLSSHDVRRFLAAVPAFHRGDESRLLFTSHGVDVRIDGHLMGRIEDPHFANIMLATFIGAKPPIYQLKRQLLGIHD